MRLFHVRIRYMKCLLGLSFMVLMLSFSMSSAQTVLFLGDEWQPSSQGTVRNDDNAGNDVQTSPLFSSFLATNANVLGDVSSSLPGSGSAPVWGIISDPGGPTLSHSVSVGGTAVGMSVVGWTGDHLTGMQIAATSSQMIDGFGNGTSGMQAGAPRPLFASGGGSGVYIGTTGTSATGPDRNAVRFDLSSFSGGGVYSFGLFGGDLETGDAALPGYPVAPAVATVTGKNPGDPHGGATGFLYVEYSDATTETILYSPDPSVFPDAAFSATSGNQSTTSSSYGNETTRFIGVATDGSKLITAVVFVVGDDDTDDDGGTEQLSFVAPMVFLDSAGNPVVPSALASMVSAAAIPTIGEWGLIFMILLLGSCGLTALKRLEEVQIA